MAAANPSTRRHIFIWVGGVVFVVLLFGLFQGRWLNLERKSKPDMVAVLRANNRGIGYMDQFKEGYPKAVEAFEEVTRLDPDWLPGQINLSIALLNCDTNPDAIARAIEILDKILAGEKNDSPKEEYLYVHFCRGIIHDFKGEFEKAIPHFEYVTTKDPQDASAWYFLGKQIFDDDKRARECFERAAKLNPYIGPALFNLATQLRESDPKRAQFLLQLHEGLKQAEWTDLIGRKLRYTEMGKYAEPIGRQEKGETLATGPLPVFSRSENFKVELAPGARWATDDDLKKAPHGELRAAIRARFGAVMVVIDYDGDGKPDLFLLSAVVENDQVRDLLLHNDGDSHFTDVSAQAGLASPRPSLGCTIADFDNDEYPDILITGVGEQHLFRNNRKGGFEDVNAQTSNGPVRDGKPQEGLDKLKTICLGACFVDLDQDGDLDLIVAQYASTPEEALKALRGEKAQGAGLAVYLNVGESPPANPSVDPPPLKPSFRRIDKPAELLGDARHTVAIAASDLDQDHDLDLIALTDGAGPVAILNDRLLRFHREAFADALVSEAPSGGILVLDVNQDGKSDYLFVGAGKKPVLLLRGKGGEPKPMSEGFTAGAINSPPLLQAIAVDIDHDGWTDVIGLASREKAAVFLHNDGERLVLVPSGLGPTTDWPAELMSLAVANFSGSCYRDVMGWSEGTGLHLHVNQGNGNNAVKLHVTGHRRVEPRGEIVRCNSDGFGVWLQVYAGALRTGLEYTTLSAGLGQSHQPALLGIGKHSEADFVRSYWPDNCWQAELNLPACQLIRMQEANRKDTSCPILFTWNGTRFVFVTDFLGAGTLGELLPGGVTNTPRPEESVKIEPEQLKPKNGEYVLKIAEPMNEATYLDRLQLIVLDHPDDVFVYPDERFVADGPNASQELLAFRARVFPGKAVDHRGRDVTAKLQHWDRDTVDGFARRSWLGFAEEHWVELDFADRLASLKPGERAYLCLAGWTDYPYPESIWAADQAGIAPQAPVLERRGPDGKWQRIAEIGFPAGLPRMMTFDVTDKLGGANCVVRIRTNMHVFWDQIFVAPLFEKVEATHPPQRVGLVRALPLEVSRASISARGCMQEFSPDGKLPTIYDYDRLDAVPVSRLAGRMTRYGDVTELLQATDDRFVIFGPGDEVSVNFDATALPSLPAGWKRSFVLRTWGYCKDCSPFTATGETIEPLPFRAMTKYPYGKEESYPRDSSHEEYQRVYNTRQVGGKRYSK